MRRLLLALLLLLPPLGAGAIGSREAAEREVAERVNRAREVAGLAPLSAEPRLARAARAHSAAMATGCFLGHRGEDGSRPLDRIQAAGYRRPEVWGEVVGAGQPTPAAIVAGWLASREHRAVLMAAEASELGVGYAGVDRCRLRRRGFPARHFWTLAVGRPDGAARGSARGRAQRLD